jgi:rubrerythrin
MADAVHPQTVIVLEDMGAARALADWLTEKGFPAEPVMPPAAAVVGDSLGLSPEATTGIEVRVTKPEHAEPARQAIDEMKEEVAAIRERRQKRAQRTGTVTAVCEECGKSSEWPASSMGTTESCPHCDAYMDIPDPEENWDDVDFGSEEDEPASEKPAE